MVSPRRLSGEISASQARRQRVRLEIIKTERSYSSLTEITTSEKFMKDCSPALNIFLKERNCKTLSSLCQTADSFVEAQVLLNLSKQRVPRMQGCWRRGWNLRGKQTRPQPSVFCVTNKVLEPLTVCHGPEEILQRMTELVTSYLITVRSLPLEGWTREKHRVWCL